MYSSTRGRTETDTAALIEALRPVAEGVRGKKYHLKDGAEKPAYFRVELSLSIREARKIMALVDAADFASLLDAA
jgi:hypothetical protein